MVRTLAQIAVAAAPRWTGQEQLAGRGATSLLPLAEWQPEAFGCSDLKFNRGHRLKYVFRANDEISQGEEKLWGTPRTEGPRTETQEGPRQ